MHQQTARQPAFFALAPGGARVNLARPPFPTQIFAVKNGKKTPAEYAKKRRMLSHRRKSVFYSYSRAKPLRRVPWRVAKNLDYRHLLYTVIVHYIPFPNDNVVEQHELLNKVRKLGYNMLVRQFHKNFRRNAARIHNLFVRLAYVLNNIINRMTVL